MAAALVAPYVTSSAAAAEALKNADDEQTRMLAEECLVVNDKDEVVGSASKEICHLNENIRGGLLHRAFSVFLFNSDGRLLLQQRSGKKITFPLRWTNTCCSHPLNVEDEKEEGAANLGVKRAAQRKLEHELGIEVGAISLDEFQYLTRIHYYAESDGAWGEHEIDHILFVQKDLEYKVNPNEVAECKYVTKAELQEMFAKRDEMGLLITPWFEMIANQFLFKWWDNLSQLVQSPAAYDPEMSKKIYKLKL
jgi:isopentenyl-diphosphate delta-isomerase